MHDIPVRKNTTHNMLPHWKNLPPHFPQQLLQEIDAFYQYVASEFQKGNRQPHQEYCTFLQTLTDKQAEQLNRFLEIQAAGRYQSEIADWPLMLTDWKNLPDKLPENILQFLYDFDAYSHDRKFWDFWAARADFNRVLTQLNDIQQRQYNDFNDQKKQQIAKIKEAALTAEEKEENIWRGRIFTAEIEERFLSIFALDRMVRRDDPYQNWVFRRDDPYTYSTPVAIRQAYMKPDEQFVFFYKDSPFCSFFQAKIEIGGHIFQSVFHYLLYVKVSALLNWDAMEKVLQMKDLEEMKQLFADPNGYRFDKKVWAWFMVDALNKGYRALFQQHRDVMDLLKTTQGKTIVLADPDDRRWGIGLMSSDPDALQRAEWQGKNLLGEQITVMRVMIMSGY